MLAKFGSAGNPDDFYSEGYKASEQMPAWLSGKGLNAYEYQCSRGVNIREETARSIGRQASLYQISLSVHAPYYISLATEDESTAANTEQHLLKSLEAAAWMGAERVVFHIGGVGGKNKNRREAVERAKKRLAAILDKAAARQLDSVLLCPETMGKQNQIGTLAEVLEFCQLSNQLLPAVDFGHLHAVTLGAYTKKEEFEQAFDQIAERLGEKTAANIHAHFSRIEFTKAGEKRHWTFEDDYGPPHEPLLEIIAQRGYTPRVICESAGTQAKDAKIMQDFYLSLVNN